MKKTKKILSAVLALVMVFGVMPMAAFAQELTCELEEHTHEDACYDLICQLEEHSHESCDSACELVVHEHSKENECYSVQCNLIEHSHNEDCYADEEVDEEVSEDETLEVEPARITKIDIITDVPTPDGALGELHEFIVSPELDIDVENIELMWFRNAEIGDLDDENWEEMEDESIFKIGYYYVAAIRWTYPENVIFDEELDVTFNGEKILEVYHDSVNGEILSTLIIAKVFEPFDTIIEGANAQWESNSDKDLVFRSNSEFDTFLSVKVDGKVIDAKNYDADKGSIVVSLKAEFLKTLDAGKHTIAIESESGEAKTEFTIIHIHSLTKVEAKKATCKDNGNKEHYTCKCGKLFEDKDAKKEITDKKSVEIPAGHIKAEKWSRSHKEHWRECSVCGEVVEKKEAHVYKENGKICQICAYDIDDPQTGDESSVGLMIALVVISMFGMSAIAGAYVYNKKRK